jgi:rod shape determining protein RodA
MKIKGPSFSFDYLFVVGALLLVVLSVVVLRSIAPSLFPVYFLYLILAALIFIVASAVGFDILSLFSKHLYFFSIFLLILPLLIGQVTRGAVRWIPIGALTIQPAEIVRPLLLIFFANYLTEKEFTGRRLINALCYLVPPVFLILIQPSLGVATLTVVGFLGTLLATQMKKKYFIPAFGIFLVIIPLVWFVMADYQKARILTFLDPNKDPYGAGYNSIQAMITVGAGKFFGRGLGKGVQTQLSFLPERHTDFIFASIAEEMGFFGTLVLLSGLLFIFWRISAIISESRSPSARAFVSGIFLTLFVQTFVHIGMNMGLLPITGVPLPLVSAGGSSLLGTSLSFALALTCKKERFS